jgi:hypothetical protein
MVGYLTRFRALAQAILVSWHSFYTEYVKMAFAGI